MAGIKDLLRASCDPTVKAYLYADEPGSQNTLYHIREKLGDAFVLDDNLLSMLGYATIQQCLLKRFKQQNFESVERVTEALNCSINNVYTYGGFSLVPTNSFRTWTYIKGSTSKEPFNCGLIFI